MAPFFPDGIYKIRNGEYTRFVADLIDGARYGFITAYAESASNKHDKWRLKNHGFGGNQITLENVSTPGSFAYADQFQGSSLFGSQNQTIWTVVKVDGGKYYLQSPDADFVWELPRGANFVNIELVHHTGQLNTKWSFERVKA